MSPSSTHDNGACGCASAARSQCHWQLLRASFSETTNSWKRKQSQRITQGLHGLEELQSATGASNREYSSHSRSSSRSDLMNPCSQLRSRPHSALDPLQPIHKPSSQSSSRSSSPASKTRSCSLPAVRRPSMRHRAAIAASRNLDLPAAESKSGQEPRDVALLRLIMAEARKRHLNRPAFQQRLADQAPRNLRRQSTAPTLWKLSQAGAVFQEAIRDVVGAVKVCSKAVGSTRMLQKAAHERKELLAHPELRWRHLALAVMRKQLDDAKAAEAEWHGLASTLTR